jgi:rare lipoprotein A
MAGATRALVACLLLLALAGCGTAPQRPAAGEDGFSRSVPGTQPARPARGGYYKDDGPLENPPDISLIENAEPRLDPLHRFANNPYSIDGRSFVPMRAIAPFKQRGPASWYGRRFHGQPTSSGEIYDMYAMTAAHPTLPIPSYAKVTNLANGRSVVVRVNDRGPFKPERVIDLSYTAAAKLGYIDAGSALVELESIQPGDMARYARRGQSGTPGAAEAIARATSSFSIISAAQAAQPEAGPAVYLQLGAFAARENAEALRSRVVRELAVLKDFIGVLRRDGAYRVRIGPFRNRDDATLDARKIRDALGIDPLVVAR